MQLVVGMMKLEMGIELRFYVSQNKVLPSMHCRLYATIRHPDLMRCKSLYQKNGVSSKTKNSPFIMVACYPTTFVQRLLNVVQTTWSLDNVG